MNIALFGKSYTEDQLPYLQMLIDELSSRNVNVSFFKPYFEKFSNSVKLPNAIKFFETHEELVLGTDMLFSIGGDGTLLDTIPFVRDSGIPSW